MRKAILLLMTMLSLGACSPEPSPCVIETAKLTTSRIENLAELNGHDLAQSVESLSEMPNQYTLVARENAVIIAPPGVRDYATRQADLVQLCYEKINEFIGITPIMPIVMQILSIDDQLKSLKEKLCPVKGVGCNTIPTKYTPSSTSVHSYKKPTVCTFAHESIHVFLKGTVLDEINIWLNEGLAVFSQHYFNNQTEVVFHPHYWEELGIVNGKPFSLSGSYVNLNLNRKEHKERGTIRDAYVTGARFWNIIYEQNPQLFRDILKDVEASRMIPMSFIRDILVPNMGEDAVYELNEKVPGLIDAYLETPRIPQISIPSNELIF